MNTDKPSFAKYFWINAKLWVGFYVASVIVSVLLKEPLWFWITTGLFVVLIIGEMVSYNKTYNHK